jgi:hypothetical protein
MSMTPEQKIKWAILEQAVACGSIVVPEPITADNIDNFYEELLVMPSRHWDYVSEFRESGTPTGLQCEFSRHYESDAVAAQMPDGTWVGWTYWYGGGKHGEPEAIDWMGQAYFVDCHEEEKMMVVQTFTKPIQLAS